MNAIYLERENNNDKTITVLAKHLNYTFNVKFNCLETALHYIKDREHYDYIELKIVRAETV